MLWRKRRNRYLVFMYYLIRYYVEFLHFMVDRVTSKADLSNRRILLKVSSTLKAVLLSLISLCLMIPLASIKMSAFLADPWLLSRRSNFLVKAWEWSAKSGKGTGVLFKPFSSCSDFVHAKWVSKESVEHAKIWKINSF